MSHQPPHEGFFAIDTDSTYGMIEAAKEELFDGGSVVVRGAVPQLKCDELEAECKRFRGFPEERWKSEGGARRPLFLGVPRSAFEQWLLTRHNKTQAIREIAGTLYAPFSNIPAVIPKFNRAVITRLESVSKNGVINNAQIHARRDPAHYIGVIAQVFLQPMTLELRSVDERRDPTVQRPQVDRGDVAIFLGKNIADFTNIPRPYYKIVDAQPELPSYVLSYSSSASEPLSMMGIIQRAVNRYSPHTE